MTSLNKLFKSIQQIQPSEKLHRSILLQVEELQKNKIAKLKFSYYATFIVAMAALIPAIQMVILAISRSGLYQFISLFYTDTDIVVAEWKSFVFTIVESLPIVEIASLLSLTLFIVWTINAVSNLNFRNRLLEVKTM